MPLPARQRFDAGEVEQRVSQVDAIGAPQEPGVAASAAPRSSVPLFIATTLRPDGTTGVHSHIKQLRQFIASYGLSASLVTPFSWCPPLAVGVFGVRLALERCSSSASVMWYRHWHEAFLRAALRRRLRRAGDCVVYAQDPLAARAALRARTSRRQQVVLVVHFRISQADEWADKGEIRAGAAVYRAIRGVEREVIPQVDRLVFVSRWAQEALLSWIPEAGSVPSAVISNFIAPLDRVREPGVQADLVTVGSLEPVKNHRFLLEVLAEANRRGRPVTLDVFGDGPLRRELASMAHSLGLDAQVRFRGFRADVRDLLPGYRAYVHASYSEASSFAIIEAMAAGLPILAAKIGPISEICDEESGARWLSLDDPGQATTALLGLLGSEPDRQAAARAARARFLRDYDATVVAPRLWSFLFDDDRGEVPAQVV